MPLLRNIIKDAMLKDLDWIVAFVLPDGRRRGKRWEGTGPDGNTWSVNTGTGPDRGVYGNWAAGESGDVVRFVTRGRFNDDWDAMRVWACERYGLEGVRARPEDLRLRQQEIDRAARAQAERKAADEAADEERGRQMAIEILLSSGDDAIALAYLAGRDMMGVQSPYLHFGEHVEYDYSAPPHPRRPAMLAPVMRLQPSGKYRAGEIMAAHRTFIDPDGTRGWCKAQDLGKKAKLCRGPVSGHIVPLLDGTDVPWVDKLRQQEATREALIVAEGIENALSAALMFPGVRCCTSISHGNLRKMWPLLPRCFDPVILVVDRDADSNGRDQIRESREIAMRGWLDQGRRVIVIAAVVGIKDLNDLLQALAREHGYRADFSNRRIALDWRALLAEAAPVAEGDPAALFWESVTGGRFGDGREPPALRFHPALPLIEQSDTTLPAMLLPVMGEKALPVGVLVAWLSQQAGRWGLAPLMLPVRLLGSPFGVVPLTTARRAVRQAQLVTGLKNALALAHAKPRHGVFCVLDPSHATVCAPGVPAEVEAVDLLIDNDDVTLAGDLLAEVAARRLEEYGMRVRSRRPWAEYANIAAMLRDMAA